MRLVITSALALVAVALAPFVTASCSVWQRTRQSEAEALATLRALTRNGLIPAEDVVAAIESEQRNTKAGGLARIARVRARMQKSDLAGAAALLDSVTVIREHTALSDYALLMRARLLEQTNRMVEARAAYEQLVREHPTSLRMREATLRIAELLLREGSGAGVPLAVKKLSDVDDASALLLAARSYQQQADATQALALYRRLYFYAPASAESAAAETALPKLGSTSSPATVEEALARADKLYAAKRYAQAVDVYTEASARFPNLTAEAQLKRGIALFNLGRVPDAITALRLISASAANSAQRAEALYYLAQTHAKARQWDLARTVTDEMLRQFRHNTLTTRALVATGQEAKAQKNTGEADRFFRTAITSFPGTAEAAPAQFEIAWAAHETGNHSESSRLLTEHLADYADKNTDNRGRAGYWAARDSERVGKTSEARALYEAMQVRYGANWYGHLAKQRLDALSRRGGSSNSSTSNFAADAPIGRAVANLGRVAVAEEPAGPAASERLTKADQLTNVGFDDWAIEELNASLASAPTSPPLNLALARIYRTRNDNLEAFNTLRRSYPDYAQMHPAELTRDEWDVFYPLAHWDIIRREATAKQLDPYTVAGLIRQESVFNPRAKSSARAYGLMQLLVGTGQMTARRYGISRAVTADALYDPLLNIQLGTGYLRDQIDRFGRIEYVAAAYNAGPGRAVRWRAELPPEIDEWAEAIPFRETRGYVQGVVRNTLQYKRLYDENGQFRPAVGIQVVVPAITSRPASDDTNPPVVQPPAPNASRPRRTVNNEQ